MSTLGSAEFRAIQFHIGTLQGATTPSDALKTTLDDVRDVFLQQNKWRKARLVETTRASHDSFNFRFALQRPDQDLGLPVGQHVFVRLHRKDTGTLVQRAYTPVSKSEEKGFVDFLVKCVSGALRTLTM
jgi:nitrate reductase (NAD(P)H)